MTFAPITSHPTQPIAADLAALTASKLFKISLGASIATVLGATFLPLLWMSPSYPAEVPHAHSQVAPACQFKTAQ